MSKIEATADYMPQLVEVRLVVDLNGAYTREEIGQAVADAIRRLVEQPTTR